MFYSPVILTKRGPLGKIWLAAHLQHKLTKAQIFSTDVVAACEQIRSPEITLALRLSSNLLLGIVRIYYRKAHYLFIDSREALNKLQLAFKSTVDLAPGSTTAAPAAITMDGALESVLQGGEEFDVKRKKKKQWNDIDTFSDTSSSFDIDMLLDVDTDMACTFSSSEFRWKETAESLSRFRARPEDITLPPMEMDFIFEDQLHAAPSEQWSHDQEFVQQSFSRNLSVENALVSTPEILRRESRQDASNRISLDRMSGFSAGEKHNENDMSLNWSMEWEGDPLLSQEQPPTNLEQSDRMELTLMERSRNESPLSNSTHWEANKDDFSNKRKRGEVPSKSSWFTVDRKTEIAAKTLKKHLSETKDLLYKTTDHFDIPVNDGETWLRMMLSTQSLQLPTIPTKYNETLNSMLLHSARGDLILPTLREADVPSPSTPWLSPTILSSKRPSNNWSEGEWDTFIGQESFQYPNEEMERNRDSIALEEISNTIPSGLQQDHMEQVTEDQEVSQLNKENIITVSSRTLQCFNMLQEFWQKDKTTDQHEVKFSEFINQSEHLQISSNKRRTAAQCFYEVLVMKSLDLLQIEQEEAFGEIEITAISNRPFSSMSTAFVV